VPPAPARVVGLVDPASARLARIAQVKRFSVPDHELSQDDGELTPTMKVKRAAPAVRDADRIEAMSA
jgi:long-chain acyl-CoA synthetase